MDFFCIHIIRNKKSSKFSLFKLMEEKFDYNNDIIYYQNMSNEFEIFKKIFLGKDLIEIMNYLSKPRISIKNCKRNEEENNDLFKSYEFDFFKIKEIYPDMLKNVKKNFNNNNKRNDRNFNNNNNNNNFANDFIYSRIVELFGKEIKDLGNH